MIRKTRFIVAMAVVWPLLLSPLDGQELEDLVDESEREEEKLRQIPGANLPGVGAQPIPGKVRLPKGEDVDVLRISQDRAIDPESYVVGPGDVLQLYIWGEFDQAITVFVNPEGYALVPTIGAFDVSNHTLAKVKEQIIAAAQNEKYPGVDITLTLESMRFFTVYLTGAVLTEGAFNVHPITRLSDLIERSGGFVDDLQGTIEETVSGKKITRAQFTQVQPTARRSIRVKSLDGSSQEVDLAMFLATGNLDLNPYLKMGDVVHVPYRTHEVFAYGSVNEEGAQEFRPGDTVGDLLTLAGDLSGSAPLEVAVIWRFHDGHTSTPISLIDSSGREGVTTADDIADVPLQGKDMLFVRSRADWQLTPTVHIHGEVKYRGRYRIVTGRTRVSEIVDLAGGINEGASLTEARVIRARFVNVEDPEFERLKLVQEAGGLADLDPEERAYLRTKEREEKGRVAVDFEKLLAGDDSQNILLEGGDVISVPEKRRTVSLSGQLKKPGLIDFEQGRKVSFYLDQAGGYGFKADKGGARLIRARTGQREKLDKNLIVDAGDEIWVPQEEYVDWWKSFQGLMRTVAETLTLVILVRAL